MKERVCVITKSGAVEWITYALKLLHIRGDDASSRLKKQITFVTRLRDSQDRITIKFRKVLSQLFHYYDCYNINTF